jgi:flagellar export protein FliJ
MKSRDSLLRLKRFHVDDKRRRVAQIETMTAEFLRMAGDLDREIAAEEQKAGITDLTHFAYPTYARAARTRRENLVRSAEELKEQLAEAKSQLEDATAELSKVQGLEGREKGADRADFPTKVVMMDGMLGLRAAQV